MQAFSSHDIFQTLYQQIMLLELKPGSTLRENALCEQFGVSRTPVRSVLQELRIAGLIEVTPYKSTRVTSWILTPSASRSTCATRWNPP